MVEIAVRNPVPEIYYSTSNISPASATQSKKKRHAYSSATCSPRGSRRSRERADHPLPPPKGGELCRGREFAWGRRECVREGMALSGIRDGLGNRTFRTTTAFPRIVRPLQSVSHRKIGRHGQEPPHPAVSGHPGTPSSQEGAGGGPEPPEQTVTHSPAKPTRKRRHSHICAPQILPLFLCCKKNYSLL